MTARFFDSHAHYWDSRFDEGEGAGALLSALFASSVSGIINVGTSPDTCRQTIRQAQAYPRMYTALGVHPSDCVTLTDPLDTVLSDIESLLRDPASKAVAVGEIGLDYHFEPYDKDLQKRYLHAQFALAESLGLPVIIHDRDAHGDCFEAALAHPHVRGVFHSYSGSAEMAHELIRRDWYISFSGTVTFKNARRVAEVAASVPLDRILAETDAPYLAPHPHRGECNHSGFLLFTISKLAELHGISSDNMAETTERNARTLFSLPVL